MLAQQQLLMQVPAASEAVAPDRAAARALIDHVFHNFEVHRVCAALAPGNLASRRVAEKAGLQFEGRLRGVIFINGQYLDSEVFGLLRPEWQARRAATHGKA